jgi:tellurite resistance protein TerC
MDDTEHRSLCGCTPPTPPGRLRVPELPVVFEVGSVIAIVVILLADLLVVARRPHVPTLKESGLWVGLYVGLALVFALAMLVFAGGEPAGQFLAGWLTEYSLSIDNLFVFVILMARFSVPKKIQQEVLMLGIIIALVLRGVFILLGARLIEDFSWIFYLFGAWLVWTAIQQLRGDHDDEEQRDSFIVRLLRRRVRITDRFDGMKLRTTEDGVRHFTPLLVVLIAIGTTDLLFALDSIPAIFGITESPFIVFTANVFALMGLRQLYFLLGGLLERLVYLKYGIAFILAFIGVKLVLHALHSNELPFLNGGEHIEWAPEISTWVSLVVIVVAMGVSTLASVVRLRHDDAEHADEQPARTGD